VIIIQAMNDNHSKRELKYKKRWLASLLRESAKNHPILVLTGARQVGKSTLLLRETPFADWRNISMDDYDALAQAKNEPASLWAGDDRIVIDEVQKSTNLLQAVKMTVDSHPHRYRFVLSGSANLLLMKKVSETMAGRAVYFTLNPLTSGEMKEIPPPGLMRNLLKGKFPQGKGVPSDHLAPVPLMWRGFMPALMQKEDSRAVLSWWEGYVATFLERDLRQLSQIDALPDFQRLMVALALRCGHILNQTELSRDVNISQPTVHRYINLLETTCLVQRLPAFAVNRTKRLIKSPKVIWMDPGLATYLAGHYDLESLKTSREAGGIFESLVFLHLNTHAQLLMPKARLFHWRTVAGKEVDFVLEWGRRLLAVEVKLTDRPKFSDIETLKLFLKEYPETVAGILVYTGKEIKMMSHDIVAIPWYLL
jgi:predicted AAA+ superfamily ATPase